MPFTLPDLFNRKKLAAIEEQNRQINQCLALLIEVLQHDLASRDEQQTARAEHEDMSYQALVHILDIVRGERAARIEARAQEHLNPETTIILPSIMGQ
jgi:hypothetical protein